MDYGTPSPEQSTWSRCFLALEAVGSRGRGESTGSRVDRDGVTAREVLHGPRGEGLREEDAAEPEVHRDAVRNPGIIKLDAIEQVRHLREPRQLSSPESGEAPL